MVLYWGGRVFDGICHYGSEGANYASVGGLYSTRMSAARGIHVAVPLGMNGIEKYKQNQGGTAAAQPNLSVLIEVLIGPQICQCHFQFVTTIAATSSASLDAE